MRNIVLLLPAGICTLGFLACSTEATTPTPPNPSSDAGSSNGDGSTAKNDSGAASTYSVGGTLTGLMGTGLILERGTETLAVAATDTSFSFPTKLATGTAYDVKVKTQPATPTQTCVVAAGTGIVASANVNSVGVTCTTNKYAVKVSVNGLTGNGLVLRNNGGDDLTVAANATTATFATSIESGASFAVTVSTQPNTPDQVCRVTGGTGTVVAGDIATVVVNCSTSRTVGGAVSGLAGSGLVLQNNAGDDLPVNANGTFAFATPLATGDAYAVSVKTQPTTPWQTCAVTNAAGSVPAGNVSDIAVVCTTNKYTVGGTVSGLSGSGAVISTNGEALALGAGATTFVFPTPIDSGADYNVTVTTQPTSPSQTCSLTNGGPTAIAGANVTNVGLSCVTNKYKTKVNVTGLSGTLVLSNNGTDDLSLTANGVSEFATSLDSGSTYNVAVKTDSTARNQVCTVAAPAGTLTTGDVTVNVSCTLTKATVFVTSTRYDGNMGGIAGADAKCQSHADAANVRGIYKAWLSTLAGVNPSTRFNKYAVPYVLVDGTQIWPNYAAIAALTPLGTAINKTELNSSPTIDPAVSTSWAPMWTNSNSAGTAYGGGYGDCGAFTNTTGSSVWGRFLDTNGGNWTSYSPATCAQTAPLVCFQQ